MQLYLTEYHVRARLAELNRLSGVQYTGYPAMKTGKNDDLKTLNNMHALLRYLHGSAKIGGVRSQLQTKNVIF